jgi:hypothetical protein
MIGDYVIPMMSLPLIFNGFIPNEPYFKIKEKPKLTGFNIGIAWTSKKQFITDCVFQEGTRILPSLPALAYKSAQQRLLKQEWFEKISQLPVKLWCFQPDADIEVDFIEKYPTNDFFETAEALTQMDLIISIDTALAHLAGAIGKPTWLILPRNSEWRWLVSGTGTSWYPSMKLFRQSTDWTSLFDTLYTHLKENYF